jgi:hypothetical protein
MHRQLITLALFAAPALALAAPQQHPSENARPHPASSSQANASAGQADAARLEACAQLASTFLDDLEKGDISAAAAYFDERMKSGVGEAKLREVWQSLGNQFGKPESRGQPQTVLYQGMPVVGTPLHFEKGDLVSQVTCDHEGKIAGFYIRPLSSSVAAPASSVK